MTKLYVDIDETVLAASLSHIHDLRPGVMSQLTLLTKMFDCSWATHWSKSDIEELIRGVNASHRMVHNFGYLDWRKVDENNKAPAIIASGSDFFWLEDPLSTGDMSLMEKMGLMDHYISVAPKGLWGFTRACRVLFERANITDDNIIAFGGKPWWFQEPLGLHFDWQYYK